jgi:hypothetical protein
MTRPRSGPAQVLIVQIPDLAEVPGPQICQVTICIMIIESSRVATRKLSSDAL